jgi:hypothetical protein
MNKTPPTDGLRSAEAMNDLKMQDVIKQVRNSGDISASIFINAFAQQYQATKPNKEADAWAQNYGSAMQEIQRLENALTSQSEKMRVMEHGIVYDMRQGLARIYRQGHRAHPDAQHLARIASEVLTKADAALADKE